MTRKRSTQWGGRSLVEKNSHVRCVAGLDFSQASPGVFQYFLDLFSGNAGKPLKEIVHACTRLQIFEKCLHWNSSSFKNPGATYFFGHSFYTLAFVPLNHEMMISWRPHARKSFTSRLVARVLL